MNKFPLSLTKHHIVLSMGLAALVMLVANQLCGAPETKEKPNILFIPSNVEKTPSTRNMGFLLFFRKCSCMKIQELLFYVILSSRRGSGKSMHPYLLSTLMTFLISGGSGTSSSILLLPNLFNV